MSAGINKKALLLVSWYNIIREIGWKIVYSCAWSEMVVECNRAAIKKVDHGKIDPSSDILICKPDQNPNISDCFLKIII